VAGDAAKSPPSDDGDDETSDDAVGIKQAFIAVGFGLVLVNCLCFFHFLVTDVRLF
jgi:hypothetical protein